MAFTSKEIQEHIQEQAGRQPAKATRLPSLDDYDKMDLFDEEDGYDVAGNYGRQ